MIASDRRRHPRYPCDLTVDVQPANESEAYRGQLADICLGGCYISMVSPLPAGVSVLVHFKAGEQQAALTGKTVTSLPGSGMGIEFTAPAGSDGSEVLRTLIEFLDRAAAKEARKQAAFSD